MLFIDIEKEYKTFYYLNQSSLPVTIAKTENFKIYKYSLHFKKTFFVILGVDVYSMVDAY